MTPVLGPALAKALTISHLGGSGVFPAFSGTTGQIDHVGVRTRSGRAVEADGALRVAAVWIAVTLLADEIGSLVWKLVEKDDVQRKPAEPPALRPLWDRMANTDQTRMGWTATLTMSLALHGVAYAMNGWLNDGSLAASWPIDPTATRLERLEDGGLKLKVRKGGETLELFNRQERRPEFMFIPRYQLPGRLDPVSPVRMAAELIGLADAYDEQAARLAGKGFAPSAVLTSSEAIEQLAASELAGRLTALHSGSNAGGVAVLGGPDLKLQPWMMSMVDAQFIQQNDRVFSVLMALWRVPPTVAGMVDKPSTWGSGVAEFSRGLERFTLRPLVQLLQAGIEAYATRWVDPGLQYRGKFDSLLSAAPKDRTEIQRLALMNGMTSVERVLAQNDEPPFGEDETVFTPLSQADAELNRVRLQAETYGALIRAGVEPSAAAAVVGFDPVTLVHLGLAPVTVPADA